MKMTLRATLAAAVLVSISCGGSSETAQADSQLSFTHKPQVTIDSPAMGAGFVAATKDGMVDVTGTSHGSSITVNGQSVAVTNGAFHARIAATPGMNFISAKMSSLWGGEAQRAFVYGSFAAPGALLPTGVLVRSNAAAFNTADGTLDNYSAIARAMLAQVDVMKYLRDLPPFNYDFGLGSVDVSVTSVDFAKDKTALALSPKAVGAHMDGSFANMVIGLHFVVHFLGDHPANAVASVDTVGFIGDINAKFSPTAVLPDPNKPGGTLTGPGIVGSMAAPDITLGTLGITTDVDFPGVNDFITWLSNHFKALISTTVANAIQASSANHFAAALNQIGLPGSFSLKPYGLNATLNIADAFDARTLFDDAGVTIGATTGFSWPALAPGAPGLAAAGSYLQDSALTATFPAASAFGVSVSFDALNQAAFAAWGQDGLTQTVYPAKSYVLFKLDPVVATPRLPPVLVPTSDGQLQLSLGDIVVTSTLRTLFLTGPIKATISARANVTLDIDAKSGALRMTLSAAPTIGIDVNDLLGIVPDALLAPLSDVLQKIAPAIVQKVVQPVLVPLPKLPLGNLIQGNKTSLGLAAPVAVSVDVAGKRVTVSGSLAQYQ